MKRQLWIMLGVTGLLFLASAQAQVTVSVSEHPEYGTYLTDGEGMTLYLFVQDAASLAQPGMAEEQMSEGVRAEAAQCTGGCLENWPPLLAEGGEFTISPEAEAQLDPALLYVADVDGRSQLVYNGWPLYYFANDTMAGDVNGQGVGDRWFVISPEGGAGGEVAGGGEAAPPAEEEAPPTEEDAPPTEEDAPPAEDGGDAGTPPAEGEDGAEEPPMEGAPVEEAPMDEAPGDDATDGAEDPMDGGADAPADDATDPGAGDDGGEEAQ